jgi:hypothetical protein
VVLLKAQEGAMAMSKNHPCVQLFERIEASGRVAPLTLTEQWELSTRWHEFLESAESAEYPFIDSLRRYWKALRQEQDTPERGKALQQIGSTPLDVFFYFVEMGFYPPPELLLVLSDCWEIYKAGGGKISMEEAFIGPAQRGAGNHARRKNSKFRKMMMAWDFIQLLNAGNTRAEAAEALSNRMGGKPDADSILREMRGPSKAEK